MSRECTISKRALSNFNLMGCVKDLNIPNFPGVFMRNELPKCRSNSKALDSGHTRSPTIKDTKLILTLMVKLFLKK